MKTKLILTFFLGLVTGGGIGYLAAKHKYLTWAQELEDYYKGIDKYAREESPEESSDISEEETEERADKDSVRLLRKEEKDHAERVDYTKYYKKEKTDEEIEEVEEDLEEEDGNDVMEYTIDMEADEYHELNCNLPPRIISEEKLGELPAAYEHETIFYCPDTDEMYDEDDNKIEDYKLLVGNCLETGYFRYEDDQELIFVQNFEHDCVYEIQKVPITEI